MIAVLLVVIAGVLFFGHGAATAQPLLSGKTQLVAGVVAGPGIGIVASLLGVAEGEFPIPTRVLLFEATTGRLATRLPRNSHFSAIWRRRRA